MSFLTPSIPERAEMLEECRASVEAQTMRRWEHLTLVDADRVGCSKTMNKLAGEARGDWIVPLADDDLLHPKFVEVMVRSAHDADIVYCPPTVTGGEDPSQFHMSPPSLPATCLFRSDLWFELGGYDEGLREQEDRALFIRAVAVGAVFKRVDEELWTYRFHPGVGGGNKSRGSV